MNDSPVEGGAKISPANPEQENRPVQPQKLELILNPEDGSLQTAPLLSVVMACTDSLYRDIYDMAHGELQIISGESLATNHQGQITETLRWFGICPCAVLGLHPYHFDPNSRHSLPAPPMFCRTLYCLFMAYYLLIERQN